MKTKKEIDIDYQVVTASLAHAETIARFNQLMARETEDKELVWEKIHAGVKTIISDPGLGFYLVALDQQQNVAGCLAITFEWSDWRNGLFWWIQSVYVPVEFRNKGVFSTMYKHVKSLALTDKRVCGIRLYVEKDNHNAATTYFGLGMVETEYRLLEDEF